MGKKITFVMNRFSPYVQLARLDKPTGIWLLLLPCWWGLFLSKPAEMPVKEMTLFLWGAVLLRGAGCTYNDIVDRKYDAKVRRTASRPLAAGALTLHQAIGFLGVQLVGGFCVLICFPSLTIQLGLASLILVGLYPWMKRITWWPQAFLGLTFNWGVLAGWASLNPSLGIAPVLLYLAGICWTLGYDTIYAYQDIEDDMRIGVKSSAIALQQHLPKTFRRVVRFGRGLGKSRAVYDQDISRTTPDAQHFPRLKDEGYTYVFLGITYVFMVFFLALAGFLEDFSWLYYAGLAILAFQLAWQVLTLNIHNPDDCMAKFKSNVLAGFLALLALICGSVR
jgi:4-hydroxybenzoate polyprenyltransferase